MNLCGLWCIISIHISLLSHWAHLALMFQQHNPALFILCKTVSVDSHRCELFKTITTGRSFIAPLIGSGKFAILEWFHQRLQPQTHSLQTERCTMCFMCLNTGHRQKTTHTNSRSLSEISPPFSQVFSKRNHPPLPPFPWLIQLTSEYFCSTPITDTPNPNGSPLRVSRPQMEAVRSCVWLGRSRPLQALFRSKWSLRMWQKGIPKRHSPYSPKCQGH